MGIDEGVNRRKIGDEDRKAKFGHHMHEHEKDGTICRDYDLMKGVRRTPRVGTDVLSF